MKFLEDLAAQPDLTKDQLKEKIKEHFAQQKAENKAKREEEKAERKAEKEKIHNESSGHDEHHDSAGTEPIESSSTLRRRTALQAEQSQRGKYSGRAGGWRSRSALLICASARFLPALRARAVGRLGLGSQQRRDAGCS